ncbi:hypothetical protein WJX73_003998 [Symbiochloris irregularis]|uniref:Protein kinase domain-containing protein n=1 Tax=Symbiochloris irregularis TaxID=706552 RepID=A0AAW1PWD5_9CHLO
MLPNSRKRSGLDTFCDQEARTLPEVQDFYSDMKFTGLPPRTPVPDISTPQQKVPLTHPCQGVSNKGLDNDNADLILHISDILRADNSRRRYVVKEMLGQGTFGQVVRCTLQDTQENVAVKVIKNQTAFYHQARLEVGILQFLNTRGDPQDQHHIVRMRDFFVHCNHLCIAFELLSINLYELIKMNHFRGLSTGLVRVFVEQILRALVVLHASNIIHCDLKPENVLLSSVEGGFNSSIKVIDFGSACFEHHTMYAYIQSRFYRSPEVLLGSAYTLAIDMWSLGCIAAELFLGLPLFPGASEHDLLVRIVEMLGLPPQHVLATAQHTAKYFQRLDAPEPPGRPPFRLRTQAEFEALHSQQAPAGKRYFQQAKLADIIDAYPCKAGLSDAEQQEQRQSREAFFDFLSGILDTDPLTRWTPRQALQHPFITRRPFTGPFMPPPDHQPPLRPPEHPTPPSNAPIYMPGMSYPAMPPSIPASIAAALATSPEAHMQAHAAAMAAVQAHFSPQAGLGISSAQRQPSSHLSSSHLSTSFPTPADMTALPSIADHPMQIPLPPSLGLSSAGGSFNPLAASGSASSHRPYPFSQLGSNNAALQAQLAADPLHLDAAGPSSLGGMSGGAGMGLYSPHGLHSMGSLGSLGSLGNLNGLLQQRKLEPVGSLEALRGTWHAPHGTLPSAGPVWGGQTWSRSNSQEHLVGLEVDSGLAGPSDWDPTYSDDQLLNEDSAVEARAASDALASMGAHAALAHSGSQVPGIGLGSAQSLPAAASQHAASLSHLRSGHGVSGAWTPELDLRSAQQGQQVLDPCLLHQPHPQQISQGLGPGRPSYLG